MAELRPHAVVITNAFGPWGRYSTLVARIKSRRKDRREQRAWLYVPGTPVLDWKPRRWIEEHLSWPQIEAQIEGRMPRLRSLPRYPARPLRRAARGGTRDG